MFSGVRLVVNQLLPLLALPFILGQVGADEFGIMIFTQAIAWYFVVLVEYGFNLTAVRAVAIDRTNPASIRTTLYDVLATKLVLFCLSLFLVSGIILAFFGSSTSTAYHLLIAMTLALGAALQPIWLFQGLEEFGLISVVQVGSRLACFGGIFLFVQDREDAYLAQFLMALPYCVNAVILLPIAVRRFGRPPRRGLRDWASASIATIRDGFDVFVSQLSTTLFSSTTTVLSGVVLGTTISGYYGLAEKMIRGVAMLTSPIAEALYPRLSTEFASGGAADRWRAFDLVKRVLVIVGAALLTAGLVIIILADDVARILSFNGAGTSEIQTTLCWLAFVPLLIFVNNIFGVQVLLGLGFKHLYRNAVLASGLLIPVLGCTLPALWGFVGFPIALFAGELLLALLTCWLAMRYTDLGRKHAAPA